MSQTAKPRVICFIDGSNLYLSLRHVFGGGKAHLPRLCHHLTGEGRKFVEWRLAAEDVYDVAILLSGDWDLVPAIQTVQQIYRKRVEVALPRIPAYHVRQSADAYLEISRSMFEKAAF